jgi:hypothetical protein
MKADEFISERELAKRTGIAAQTLRNWRWARKGFPYIRIGRTIRYSWVAVKGLLDQQRVDPDGK